MIVYLLFLYLSKRQMFPILIISYIIWRCTTISELMINEQIRDKEVRLIGEDGSQLGIMSAKEAFRLAQEAELDLSKDCAYCKTAGMQDYRLRKVPLRAGS